MSPNFDAVLAKSKLGFSDGTRGLDEIPMHIRPAAFGAATYEFEVVNGQPHFHNFQIIGGQVPGEQTVPRAETWAAIVLLTRVHFNAVARLGIDAAYVTLGSGNRHKLCKGKNGDLWGLFFTILDLRTAEVGISKVTSHLEDVGTLAVEQDYATICDIVGNALADEAAELTAKLLKPNKSAIEESERI